MPTQDPDAGWFNLGCYRNQVYDGKTIGCQITEGKHGRIHRDKYFARGEKICVHGDYDVDGVCAATLLTRTLRILGADVDVCVPHRQLDGYDIQPETVRRLAESGVRLIITVDCGVAAFPASEAASRLGIDLIVVDHHLPGAQLPPLPTS